MFKRVHRETRFDSPWIELFYDDVLDNHQKKLKYNVVHFKGESVVVLVRNGDQLLMTENYRYPIETVQIEFPSGGVEDGESPEEAAYREVLEETGIKTRCRKCRYSFYPSNGITDQKIHVVFADYAAGELTAEDEILKCYWMDEKELKAKFMAGEITDALTVIAYFYWLLNGDN